MTHISTMVRISASLARHRQVEKMAVLCCLEAARGRGTNRCEAAVMSQSTRDHYKNRNVGRGAMKTYTTFDNKGRETIVHIPENDDPAAEGLAAVIEDDRRRDALHNAAPALLEALKYTRELLANLTSEEFERGGDKPARDRIDRAIAQATNEKVQP